MMNPASISIPIDWPLVEDLIGTEPEFATYTGANRSREELHKNWLVGAAGEYAFASWLGETDAWVENRRAVAHGYAVDLESDIPGYRIDVKSSAARWDMPRLASYRLFVESHHLHRDFRYVLAVVDAQDCRFVGWATDEDLMRSFDNRTRGGRLVHIISGARLRELPPAAEVRDTWSIPN